MYLGIREQEEYDLLKRPIRAGDAVCFMTDGVSDIFDRENSWDTMQASQLYRLFSEGDWAEKTQDDATAICIEVCS
jgi:serine phosphatase RsbU (regulator of sigma subunit)